MCGCDASLAVSQPATCAEHAVALQGLQAYFNIVLQQVEGQELWRLRTRLSLVLATVDALVNQEDNTCHVDDVARWVPSSQSLLIFFSMNNVPYFTARRPRSLPR